MGLSADADSGPRGHPLLEPEEADDVEALRIIIEGQAKNRSEAIARRLLQEHRSLAGMLLKFADESADWGQIDYPVESQLVRLARAFSRSFRADAMSKLRLGSPNMLYAYLQFDMRQFKREQFRALYLDAGNALLADRMLWEGSTHEVQVHPREVVREALEANASAVIFAHNHPSGDPTPTAGDIEATVALVRACQAVQIKVWDHVVVGARGILSMRAAGALDAIEASSFGSAPAGLHRLVAHHVEQNRSWGM